MKMFASFILILFIVVAAQASPKFIYENSFDLRALRTQAGGTIDLDGQMIMKLEIEPIASRAVGQPTYQPGEVVCLAYNPDSRGELVDCLQYKTIAWKVQTHIAVATYTLTVTNLRTRKVVRMPSRDLTVLAESQERYPGETRPPTMPSEFTARIQLPYGIVAFADLPNFKIQQQPLTLVLDARLNSTFKQIHFLQNKEGVLAPSDVSPYVQEVLSRSERLPLDLVIQLRKGHEDFMLASCPIGGDSACTLPRQ